MGISNDPQTRMGEDWIEDGLLLEILEDREAAKTGRDEYTKLDKKAKAHILSNDYGTKVPVRCGRFVVSASKTDGRTVDSFDVKPGVKVSIGLAKDNNKSK